MLTYRNQQGDVIIPPILPCKLHVAIASAHLAPLRIIFFTHLRGCCCTSCPRSCGLSVFFPILIPQHSPD
jgi:hypothetical protein